MLAMLAFFVALIVESAQIFDLVVPQISRICFAVMILVVAYYLRPPWKREDLPMLLFGGAALLYLIIEHVLFVVSTNSPPNFNAVASYLPMVAFVPAYRSQCSLTTMLRILLAVIVAYLLIYLLGFNYFTTTDFGISRVVHTSDADRGTRMFLLAAFASYVFFYALSNAKMHNAARLALMALTIVTLYLGGYRTFMLVFAVVALLSVMRMTGIGVTLGLYAIFALVCTVILWGIVSPSWNPFVFFGHDSSANARAAEYVLAQQTIGKHWQLGIGIASSFQAQQDFIGSPIWKPLYPTDLGAVGPLVLFGLPGLIAFMAMSFFAINAPIRDRNRPELRALRLNGIVCGMMGVISPSLLLEQNSFFFAMLLAVWLREWRQPGAERPPLIDRSRGLWVERA